MDLRQCRLRGGYLGLRMLEFFQGHGTVAHQRLAAVEVIGGGGQRRSGCAGVGGVVHGGGFCGGVIGLLLWLLRLRLQRW